MFPKDYPYTAKAPNLSSVASTTTSQTGKQRSFWTLGRRNVEDDGVSEATRPSDITFYAFNYDECVIRARDNPVVTCPNHQDLPLEFIAPDTVSELVPCMLIIYTIYYTLLYCILLAILIGG